MNSPIHPLLVHFPVVMISLGVIAQIVSMWKPEFFNRLAMYLYSGGLVVGVVAYLTGEGGEEFAEDRFGATEAMIAPHETFALWTLIVVGVIIVLKIFSKNLPKKLISPLLLVLSLCGGVLIVTTGHYGGQIVYHI